MKTDYTSKTLQPQILKIDFKIKTKFENGVNRNSKPRRLNYLGLYNINIIYYIFANKLTFTNYIAGLITKVNIENKLIRFNNIGIIKIRIWHSPKNNKFIKIALSSVLNILSFQINIINKLIYYNIRTYY